MVVQSMTAAIPWALAFFCSASNTLSLLIKDMSKACCWVSKLYVDSVAKSKAVNNNERIHELYVQACTVKECTQTVIATFCETRFGSYHLVFDLC
jgi:hypothetical protein